MCLRSVRSPSGSLHNTEPGRSGLCAANSFLPPNVRSHCSSGSERPRRQSSNQEKTTINKKTPGFAVFLRARSATLSMSPPPKSPATPSSCGTTHDEKNNKNKARATSLNLQSNRNKQTITLRLATPNLPPRLRQRQQLQQRATRLLLQQQIHRVTD